MTREQMTRENLIHQAIIVNENYRCCNDDHDLEVGFLYGTAEMVVALTLGSAESYHDLREQIARQIDAAAAAKTYPLLTERA